MKTRKEYDPREEAVRLCSVLQRTGPRRFIAVLEDALRAGYTAGVLGRPATPVQRDKG